MTTAILILLILSGGSMNATYLGEFRSPAECQRAIPQAAQVLKDHPAIAGSKSAILVCANKTET